MGKQKEKREAEKLAPGTVAGRADSKSALPKGGAVTRVHATREEGEKYAAERMLPQMQRDYVESLQIWQGRQLVERIAEKPPEKTLPKLTREFASVTIGRNAIELFEDDVAQAAIALGVKEGSSHEDAVGEMWRCIESGKDAELARALVAALLVSFDMPLSMDQVPPRYAMLCGLAGIAHDKLAAEALQKNPKPLELQRAELRVAVAPSKIAKAREMRLKYAGGKGEHVSTGLLADKLKITADEAGVLLDMMIDEDRPTSSARRNRICAGFSRKCGNGSATRLILRRSVGAMWRRGGISPRTTHRS
jgi:hypothetical protein